MQKRLMRGNDAIAEAAIRAECMAYFGYPITPQNEIPEYMAAHLGRIGGIFVQAESELAAINMVYGAAATGARAMTSSSSPGIALKQEGLSYLAGADLPCVMVSVSRAGPGLGGILPSQSDYFQAVRGGGNGDYFTPVYAPSSVQEAADLTQKAFHVADKYRTPVIVLIDGILGQMMEPVVFRDAPRAKMDISWVIDGELDTRPRRVITSLDLAPEPMEELNRVRFARYEQIKQAEVMVESQVTEGDEIAIAGYGIPARIAQNAIELLRKEGIRAALIRPITLWPFPETAFANLPQSVKHVLVAELSMGQMVQDVQAAVAGRVPVHFYGRCGGMIFEPMEIVEQVREIVRKS